MKFYLKVLTAQRWCKRLFRPDVLQTQLQEVAIKAESGQVYRGDVSSKDFFAKLRDWIVNLAGETEDITFYLYGATALQEASCFIDFVQPQGLALPGKPNLNFVNLRQSVADLADLLPDYLFSEVSNFRMIAMKNEDESFTPLQKFNMVVSHESMPEELSTESPSEWVRWIASVAKAISKIKQEFFVTSIPTEDEQAQN